MVLARVEQKELFLCCRFIIVALLDENIFVEQFVKRKLILTSLSEYLEIVWVVTILESISDVVILFLFWKLRQELLLAEVEPLPK